MNAANRNSIQTCFYSLLILPMRKQKKQSCKRLTPLFPGGTGGLLQAKRFNLRQQMYMLMKSCSCWEKVAFLSFLANVSMADDYF